MVSELNVIEDSLERINTAAEIMFDTAHTLFNARDRGKVTPEIRMLTDIGMYTVAIKIACGKIETRLKILKDLTE